MLALPDVTHSAGQPILRLIRTQILACGCVCFVGKQRCKLAFPPEVNIESAPPLK